MENLSLNNLIPKDVKIDNKRVKELADKLPRKENNKITIKQNNVMIIIGVLALLAAILFGLKII